VPPRIEGDTQEQQVAFLAEWYPQIRDQVERRTPDPVRREALIQLVERLNATGWAGPDTIVANLQEASDALARLSLVLAKRRRRPRKPRKPGESSSTSEPQTPPS
jgi:hypothetical protein